MNIIEKSGPQKNVILAIIHKLGLFKQFVKALDKNGECLKYLGNEFLQISDKLHARIFDGP